MIRVCGLGTLAMASHVPVPAIGWQRVVAHRMAVRTGDGQRERLRPLQTHPPPHTHTRTRARQVTGDNLLIARETARVLGMGTNIQKTEGLPEMGPDGEVRATRVDEYV